MKIYSVALLAHSHSPMGKGKTYLVVPKDDTSNLRSLTKHGVEGKVFYF